MAHRLHITSHQCFAYPRTGNILSPVSDFRNSLNRKSEVFAEFSEEPDIAPPLIPEAVIFSHNDVLCLKSLHQDLSDELFRLHRD